MTRYSHQSSVRSEGKIGAERALNRGKRVNGSTGNRSSDGADLSPAQVQPALRKEITHLREKVIMARLELRESRVAMRQQHSLIRSLETRLLNQWRTFGDSSDHDAITELHAELCSALEELGPMEQNYDDQEDGLDTLEFDLEAKEERFYGQDSQAGLQENKERLSAEYSSTSFSSDESEQDHLSPQYLYYSRVGDAQIARERLMDLEAQKEQYLDIERERDALGVPLYQENTDFLSQYDKICAEHQRELEKIERDVQSLEIQAGFSKIKDPAEKITFRDLGWDQEDNIGSRHSSPISEPGLAGGRSGQSREEYPRRKSENDILALPTDPRSSRERINQWILERLKNTPIEQLRHKTELNRPNLDDKAWWSLVCHFWQLDRAAHSSQNSSRHTSGASISAKAQVLRGSLDADLTEASIALHIETKTPSITQETTRVINYAEQDIHQLDYLDLAARPRAKNGKIRRKRDSMLGC
ncbi:MAG: hypothetical protein Q9205_003881 [Flavoplaca limonia]